MVQKSAPNHPTQCLNSARKTLISLSLPLSHSFSLSLSLSLSIYLTYVPSSLKISTVILIVWFIIAHITNELFILFLSFYTFNNQSFTLSALATKTHYHYN